MSGEERERGGESIAEPGREPTEQRPDEGGGSSQPAGLDENEPSPHEGEEGQDIV